MKRLAVVASGWHFPLHFFQKIAAQKGHAGWEVDLFCISHRDPSFSANEKKEMLARLGTTRREHYDRELYERIATVEEIQALGWDYVLEPNTIGDWGNTNQWLLKHDYRVYDKFLFTHDDNFILTDTMFADILPQEDWLILGNSDGHTSRRLRRWLGLPKEFTIRGSFEFFTREMLDIIDGKFDMSEVKLDREGEVSTSGVFGELSDWNNTVTPLITLIKEKKLRPRIKFLSRYYRMSRYCLEGERGFIHKTEPLNTFEEEQGLDAVELYYAKPKPRLVYLSTARVPDDWAHVLQTLTMCEAFADVGAEVELVVPRRSRTSDVNPFAYASVKPNFTITRLFCLDLFPGTQRRFFYWLRTISFFIAAKLYLAHKRYDVLYTREHQAGLFFRGFIYEVHAVPKANDMLYRRLWKRARGLVVLTSFIRNRFVTAGIPQEWIQVAPDAVMVSKFSTPLSKKEARIELRLPNNAYLMGYVGTLKTMRMEKGVACAVHSLGELPPEVHLVVVGGETEDIAEYKTLAEKEGVAGRVVFVGKVAHAKVPLYLKAFDIVVAPFPDFEHYRFFMSPLKIFEYMASGVPMIVSDLPSLREVLSERTAAFIPPADASALAKKVLELRAHPEAAQTMAEAAKEDARARFSWSARARAILRFIKMHYA